MNFIYRIKFNNKLGLFAGIGPFYEYERWNYNGVPDELVIPLDVTPIERKSLKLGSYLSMKLNASEKLFLDFSLYHQSRLNELISTPRLASSSMARIGITKHLGFNIVYQFIYDYKPIVPIRKDFHKVILGFSVNF